MAISDIENRLTEVTERLKKMSRTKFESQLSEDEEVKVMNNQFRVPHFGTQASIADSTNEEKDSRMQIAIVDTP